MNEYSVVSSSRQQTNRRQQTKQSSRQIEKTKTGNVLV